MGQFKVGDMVRINIPEGVVHWEYLEKFRRENRHGLEFEVGRASNGGVRAKTGFPNYLYRDDWIELIEEDWEPEA